MMPGKKPASATPSRKRSTKKLNSPLTVAISAEMMPQVTMMRAIQSAGAEFLQREIARHFENEIADEEDPRVPGKDQRRELQVRVHGQRGEAEIDAVEVGKEVGQHQE